MCVKFIYDIIDLLNFYDYVVCFQFIKNINLKINKKANIVFNSGFN